MKNFILIFVLLFTVAGYMFGEENKTKFHKTNEMLSFTNMVLENADDNADLNQNILLVQEEKQEIDIRDLEIDIKSAERRIKHGKKTLIAGSIITGIGMAVQITGAILFNSSYVSTDAVEDASSLLRMGSTLMNVGFGLTGAGIVVGSVGAGIWFFGDAELRKFNEEGKKILE